MRFIDLFAGIGGFRLALEKKGLTCVFSSEIDSKARKVYKENFGEEPSGDIKEIKAEEIPSFDILCGGFPCQSFSLAGNKKGLEDDRGNLFYEILRIAEYHKPKILLLENVRNILKIQGGKVIKEIERSLKELGYSLEILLLNSFDYGLPQQRIRVYIVGLREGYTFTPPLPLLENKTYLRDVLDKEVDPKTIITRTDYFLKKDIEHLSDRPVRLGYFGKNGMRHQGSRINSAQAPSISMTSHGGGTGHKTGAYYIPPPKGKSMQGMRIISTKAPSTTITATHAGEKIAVGGVLRRLSLTECKRCMGFPEDFRGATYRQLGNAVIPKMVEVLFEGIKKS